MKPAKVSRPALCILVVEDETAAMQSLFRLISKRFPDGEIHLAEHGRAGVELFRAQRPDLVITDINMPEMDGIAMAAEIKALDPGIQIIAITAKSDTHYLLDAIKIGINRYVLKPIEMEKLFQAMDDCVARITLNRQLKAQNDYIRKLSLAVEQSSNMIMIANSRGAVEYVNPMFAKVAGYTPDEVSGLNLRVLLADSTPLGSFEMLWSRITRGFEWRGEFVQRRKAGGLLCLEASISPLAIEEGAPTHFIVVMQDITERKEAEGKIRHLNDELEQRVKERTAELESFCYSVSHDLRAPLRGLNGFSGILQEDYADQLDETGKHCLQRIQGAAVEMGRLIDGLLKLARVTRGDLCQKRVNLSTLAGQIVEKLSEYEPERRVEVAIQAGLEVECDLNFVRMLLASLLENAWKYTCKEPHPRIAFGKTLQEGEVVYFVQDNGVGFDMAHASHLYKPFHRLHGNGEFAGNGIVLATAERIVSRHGGRIWAEAETGKGAKFSFTLSDRSAER